MDSMDFFFYFLACHWYKRFILLLFKLVNKLGKTQNRFFRVKKLSVMSAILSHRLMVYSRRNSRWFEHWKNQRSWLHGIFRSLARIAGRGVRSRTGARWQDQHTKESRANGKKGAFVLTTSIAKTMPQSMKLIGRLTKNCKVAVRTAITLELFFPVSAWAKFKERQTSHWVQTWTYLHFPGFFFVRYHYIFLPALWYSQFSLQCLRSFIYIIGLQYCKRY